MPRRRRHRRRALQQRTFGDEFEQSAELGGGEGARRADGKKRHESSADLLTDCTLSEEEASAGTRSVGREETEEATAAADGVKMRVEGPGAREAAERRAAELKTVERAR